MHPLKILRLPDNGPQMPWALASAGGPQDTGSPVGCRPILLGARLPAIPTLTTQGGRLILAGIQPGPAELLRRTGLTDHLTVVPAAAEDPLLATLDRAHGPARHPDVSQEGREASTPLPGARWRGRPRSGR